MTGGEITVVAGIEIPSTDPVFLAVISVKPDAKASN